MIGSYIIGIAGIVSLMILWVIVQGFWRKVFSDEITDEDVLSGRTDCSNCGCTTICKDKLRRISTE
jgi:hypothetical protein